MITNYTEESLKNKLMQNPEYEEKPKIKKLKRTKTKTKLFKKKYEQKIQESAKSSERRQNSFEQKKMLKINLSINNIYNSETKKKDEEPTERKSYEISTRMRFTEMV